MSRRTQYRIMFWVGCVCLPASLISGLFLLNAVNPMAVAFLTRFDVVNASGEDLSITPVGAVGSSGRRRTLPLSLSPYLSIPSLRDRSFPLPAGTRRSFTYDWDDIQFAELLLVSRSGSAREIVVDASPTERQYRRPATNHFVIPPLEILPFARPEVHAVVDAPKQSRLAIIWALVLAGIASPIGVLYARSKLKTANQTMIPASSS